MVEAGARESNTGTASVTGNSERTTTLNKHLEKVSLIGRRIDRKLLMFSQRRLGRNCQVLS